jgi:hypothetical protein
MLSWLCYKCISYCEGSANKQAKTMHCKNKKCIVFLQIYYKYSTAVLYMNILWMYSS